MITLVASVFRMKVKKVRKYKVIGIMSGTSMDGVDVAYCQFMVKKKKWEFFIRKAQIFPYPPAWRDKLSTAHSLSGEPLLKLNARYGKFLGQLCNQFIKQNKIKQIDLIASHGHTVFHQPGSQFTFQLGDGNAIHAKTGLPVVFDFRSLDVALGGEGAPLVPIGDKLLFSDVDVCLNLGGIANLSMDLGDKRKAMPERAVRYRRAFDICFCNMALNYLSLKAGKDYDKDGRMARQGLIKKNLLDSLKKLYHSSQKKNPSLSREGFEKEFRSLLDNESIPLNDRLRTVSESIATEIVQSIPSKKKIKVLATGGGALNHFLIELIKDKLPATAKVILPAKTIINFKEALVFALLGILRLRNETNVLKSVTGASHNSCSGVLIG
jgi:anhydro-N-acetylmuramic acid kinase